VSRVAVEVDPFVLVAAERYALHRWLTAASELTANSIRDNAAVLANADEGAAGAIVYDVIALLKETDPDSTLGSREEWEANRRRWRETAEALLENIGMEPVRTTLRREFAAVTEES
jgi:hypothetical protein